MANSSTDIMVYMHDDYIVIRRGDTPRNKVYKINPSLFPPFIEAVHGGAGDDIL